MPRRWRVRRLISSAVAGREYRCRISGQSPRRGCTVAIGVVAWGIDIVARLVGLLEVGLAWLRGTELGGTVLHFLLQVLPVGEQGVEQPVRAVEMFAQSSA